MEKYLLSCMFGVPCYFLFGLKLGPRESEERKHVAAAMKTMRLRHSDDHKQRRGSSGQVWMHGINRMDACSPVAM